MIGCGMRNGIGSMIGMLRGMMLRWRIVGHYFGCSCSVLGTFESSKLKNRVQFSASISDIGQGVQILVGRMNDCTRKVELESNRARVENIVLGTHVKLPIF